MNKKRQNLFSLIQQAQQTKNNNNNYQIEFNQYHKKSIQNKIKKLTKTSMVHPKPETDDH